jgi:uncharacterized lipoprotein YmbA
MKKLICLTTTLSLFALLVACSSSHPSNYYRLSIPPGPTPNGNGPSIGTGPITVPQYLKRNSMVYGAGDNRIEISPNERWAEPLSDGIQRVMSLNLARELDTQSIQTFPWPASQAPDYGVKLTLLELDASAGKASLVVEWSVRKPGEGGEVGQRISRLELPLNQAEFSGAAVAPAYSELLYQLSREIAAVISADLEKNTGR